MIERIRCAIKQESFHTSRSYVRAIHASLAFIFPHNSSRYVSLFETSELSLVEAVRPLLQSSFIGKTIYGYESVGSTNTVARAWAEEEAPSGTLIVAENQTAGRGRHARRWQTQPGKNLTMSLILRTRLSPQQLGQITLAASVAVLESISSLASPLSVSIKWPNDILLEGLKCCGMLLESFMEGGSHPVVILGIGLNVNQQRFPSELEPLATSLMLQIGRPISRTSLLTDLLYRLEQRYQSLYEDQGAQVRKIYEHFLAENGTNKVFRWVGRTDHVEGTILGITEHGALRLKTNKGVQILHAGEITSSP